MTGWDWFWAVGITVGFIWQVASILGPFQLNDIERSQGTTPGQRWRAWRRGWLSRPRPSLSFGDWMPHSGRMFMPTFVGVALVYGGIWVLFGSDQTFRLGGAMALLAGVPLALVIVGYVRRPVRQAAPPPSAD